jgi:PGF-pre-PGF domain-containing protein
MLKSLSLFKFFSYRCNLGEKFSPSNRNPWHNTRRAFTVIIVFSFLLSLCGSACADNFPPAPPSSNIVKETWVSESLIAPATAVCINITEYDVQQMVKNITIEFREPVTYISFVIDVLKDKPFVANAPSAVPVIQYYSIRFLTELADKITNVTIVFTIKKAVIESKNIEEGTILHYQYDGSKFEMCPTKKVGEDETFFYFTTETKASPYFAIAGAAVINPWWFAIVTIAAISLFTVIGIRVYRRRKLTHLQNLARA